MKLSKLQDEYLKWINVYCQNEFEHDADARDLERIGVMYSTFDEYFYPTNTYGDEHEIQVYANIAKANDPKLHVFVDNKEVFVEALGAKGFLDDVKGWTFDILYGWAVEKADDNKQLWEEDQTMAQHNPTMAELYHYGEYPEQMDDDYLLEVIQENDNIRKYISTFRAEANEMTDEELRDAIIDEHLLEGIYLYNGMLYDVDRTSVPPMQF